MTVYSPIRCVWPLTTGSSQQHRDDNRSAFEIAHRTHCEEELTMAMNATRAISKPVGAELLLWHPALPAGLDAVPALPDPTGGWGGPDWVFRASVLATVLDALAGRLGSDRRTDYRYDHDHPRVPVLIEPTGQQTPLRRVGDHLPHCQPPPAVYRALDSRSWTLAHQPDALDEGAGTLGVLASPDRRDVEETYVRAAAEVEQLDPATWVKVAALWIAPARSCLLIVPAGLVALYEPRTNARSTASLAELPDDQAWLPYCRHCDEPLFDPSCQPGMYYPQHDPGPEGSWWCPNPPRADRPRPHAASWRLVEQ
jgi:hypothetical protein